MDARVCVDSTSSVRPHLVAPLRGAQSSAPATPFTREAFGGRTSFMAEAKSNSASSSTSSYLLDRRSASLYVFFPGWACQGIPACVCVRVRSTTTTILHEVKRRSSKTSSILGTYCAVRKTLIPLQRSCRASLIYFGETRGGPLRLMRRSPRRGPTSRSSRSSKQRCRSLLAALGSFPTGTSAT